MGRVPVKMRASRESLFVSRGAGGGSIESIGSIYSVEVSPRRCTR